MSSHRKTTAENSPHSDGKQFQKKSLSIKACEHRSLGSHLPSPTTSTALHVSNHTAVGSAVLSNKTSITNVCLLPKF